MEEQAVVNVYSLEGEIIDKILLPDVFYSEYRPDLIKRDVIAIQANRRQPYGVSKLAGMKHSAEWWGKGRGVSRVPRIKDSGRGAQSPGCVSGRRAHPPRAERDWSKKINKKERNQAKCSALSGMKNKDLVMARGHKFDMNLSLPVVVDTKIENLTKTKDIVNVFKKIGVYEDILRAKCGKHIRAGRGKMRNRKYRIPKSLLLVISDTTNIEKSIRNLPGVDVSTPHTLNTELMAPGGTAGRLAVFSVKALQQLGDIAWQKKKS